MVIVYDLETKEILGTEENVVIPELPPGDTATKMKILKEDGKGFISMPYELGEEIFDYKLQFDAEGNFVGLQPKEVKEGE